MGRSDKEKYFVSGSFDGHNAFYGPCKDIASVSLKTALDSSTLQGVLFINKSELVFRHALGSGSFGTVYKGLLFHQDVAIKCFKVDNSVSHLNRAISGVSEDSRNGKGCPSDSPNQLPDVIVALEREVAILKSMSFPQIVQFIGISLNPAAIVTGYCEKGSLFDIIKFYREFPSSLKEFSWSRRLKIAFDAAAGMEYLHFNPEHPVMHGDLKSPNLLIDENFNCYVADFNTSRFITSEQMKASLVANNPYWLAPEVYFKNRFSKAIDVYPFGIIMWELLTLMLPFQKGDEITPFWTVAISVSLKNERPYIPPNEELLGGPCPVYDEYCELMKQCWSREEEERPDYRDIASKIHKMWHKVHIQEQEQAEKKAAEASSGGNPTSKVAQSDLSSSDELEIVLERVKSEENTVHYYDRMKLGSSKKWGPSPFGQGPSSSISASDALSLQEATKQATKSQAIDHKPSVDTTAEAAITGLTKSQRERRDPKAEAQRRWSLIRSVLHLIIDQKRFLTHELDEVLSRKTMGSCYQSERKSRKQIAQALFETIQDHKTVAESKASEDLRKMQGWGFIREMIFSDLGPTLHPAWDVLSGNVLARFKLLSSNTLLSLESAYTGQEQTGCQGVNKWQFVREAFFGDKHPAESAVPESWQKLLELLFPSGTCQTTTVTDSTIKAAYNNDTSKKEDEQTTEDQKTTQNSALEMIIGSGSIMDKHWDFLSNFMNESIGEISPTDNDSAESGRWKNLRKIMIVDSEGPSAEKWSFLKDWILAANLSEDWNSVIAFVKDRETPPKGEDWENFRKLFFENRSIRDSGHWGFLKDLFLIDGNP